MTLMMPRGATAKDNERKGETRARRDYTGKTRQIASQREQPFAQLHNCKSRWMIDYES